MIEVSKKGKVKLHWKVTPYDYSPEKAKEIIALFAKKYGLLKENIKLCADFIVVDENGENKSITNDVIDNIQDPIFQEKLFQEYIKVNDVKNYDFDYILSIDKELNSKIDYQVYDKFRKFSLKWIKFSNFQSYGESNYFDFTTLNGIVLLNGEPANQSGKTTFAVDLLHFLLFGKSTKVETQDEIFNKNLPEATNVIVEGCIVIEGENYIIKRTLSRPKLSNRSAKSKVTQKVEYYRLVGENLESLEDYVEVENGVDTRQTNKIIKEFIGREEDFDLMMCITGSNLDSLINEKPTDRGRLFSRWIGLLPLEAKDTLARDYFNSSIKPRLLTNQFNRETLKQEIEAYNVEIENLKESTIKSENNNAVFDKEIKELENQKTEALASKSITDKDLLKIDITTLRNNIQAKKNEGVQKKQMLNNVINEINNIGEVDFSIEKYDKLLADKMSAMLEQQNARTEAHRLMNLINQLKTSEYCPTCGKKLDNVDNSKQIKENQDSLDNLIEEGKKITENVNNIENQIASMKENMEKYNKLNSLNNQKPILELSLEKLRTEYKELIDREAEYNKNADAIDKNNNIDIKVRNIDTEINTKRTLRENNIRVLVGNKNLTEQYNNEIAKRNDIIEKINQEEKVVFNWKLYLEMVGKNGISKMVMRKTLPIINARLAQILEDVCDFDVNVSINNKNEVTFNIIKNGQSSNIKSASGFERTATALALRSVLADISNIPRLNFCIYDEILGRVAKENYDKMNILFERISKDYDFVFQITHLDEIKEWSNQIVTVTKNSDGISSLNDVYNRGKLNV
jgi:DNA repair exonuclease SbcCD ATPase subunit